MAEESPVENRGTVEAAYNKLIDIEFTAENGNSSRERSPQENTDNAPLLTQYTPRSTESPSLEGNHSYLCSFRQLFRVKKLANSLNQNRLYSYR